MTSRKPPQYRNVQAERALLGALMIDPAQAERWVPVFLPDDFTEPRHAAIFSAMQRRHADERPIDPVSVTAEVTSLGLLRDVGQENIHDIFDECVSSDLAPTWAREVLENAIGRGERPIMEERLAGRISLVQMVERLQGLRARLEALTPHRAQTLEGLMDEELEPVRWVVPGLLAEGLALLGSKRKLGKSWLVYGLVIAVGAGGVWLGQRVPPGEVLYLALEDGKRRLQDRGRKLLAGASAPPGITLELEWPRMDLGGAARLDTWLKTHPAARLVVVDVFAKVRPPAARWADPYLADYEVLGRLKALADRYHVAILLVHHTRKQEATDVFDELMGSGGISGAPDTLLILARARGAREALLHVTARDTPEGQYALRFDPESGVWSLMGDAVDVGKTPEQAAILRVLRAALPDAVSAKGVAMALGFKDAQDYSGVRARLQRMVEDGSIVALERGFYTIPPRDTTTHTSQHIHPSQASQRHNHPPPHCDVVMSESPPHHNAHHNGIGPASPALERAGADVGPPDCDGCDVVTPPSPQNGADGHAIGMSPVNCMATDTHAAFWHDLPDVGWTCVAQACQEA
jgi:hypothetical protein